MSAAENIKRKKYLKNLQALTTKQLDTINEIVVTPGALDGLVENKTMLLAALNGNLTT